MEVNRESFRAVSEFTNYEVSSVGRVRRSETGKVMKQTENSYGYLVLNLSKDGKHKQKKVHQLVAEAFLTNPENKRTVDHIDSDRKNNCIGNLRFATHSENSRNTSKRANTTSKYYGVCFHKNADKWVAQIQIGGRRKHLGYFTDEKQGAEVFNKAAAEFYKEFRKINVFSD